MSWVVAGLVLLGSIVLYVAYGIFSVLVIGKKRAFKYWQDQAAQKIKPGDIKIVALGDSTMQAIGATRPQEGTAGRVVEYLRQKTNKKVHITNLSVSGARANNVASTQIKQANFENADLVIIAVGANDANNKTPLTEFEAAIQHIAKTVPAHKTIMADVAMVKNREHYQKIVETYRNKHGLLAASLKAGFKDVPKAWRLTAKDFFHPSSYGYTFWFKAFQPALDTLIDKLKK